MGFLVLYNENVFMYNRKYYYPGLFSTENSKISFLNITELRHHCVCMYM